MAVLNIATPPDVLAVINRLPQETRFTAFKAANPQLAAEIEALENDPRRVRRLDVDAAVEAMKWIDDPVVIEALVAADKRQGVLDAAHNRMNAMNRALTVTPNEKNTLERTARALAKPTTEALDMLSGMSVFSVADVFAWIKARPDSEIADVLTRVLPLEPLRDHNTLSELVKIAFERVDILNPGWPALAEVLYTMPQPISAVAHQWKGPWPATMATVFALVHEGEAFPARDYTEAPKITPEAESVWRQMSRWELLLWAGAVTDADLPKLAADMRNMTSLHQVNIIASVQSAPLAEWMIETAAGLGLLTPTQNQWYWHARQISALCHIEGVRDEYMIRILPMLDSYSRDPWLWGTLPQKPSQETVKHCMRTLSCEDVVEMLRENRHLAQEEKDVAAERLSWMLQFAFDEIPGIPKQSQQQHYWRRSEALDDFVSARLAEALGDDAAAWQMYWTLYRTADGLTFREIVAAAQAMS